MTCFVVFFCCCNLINFLLEMVKYAYNTEKGHTFHIYDVAGQRNERNKWIGHFKNFSRSWWYLILFLFVLSQN